MGLRYHDFVESGGLRDGWIWVFWETGTYEWMGNGMGMGMGSGDT